MPNKDNWKKRFDDEFAVNNCNCGSFFAWADYDGYTPDEIKHFIQKELERVRQEERERIIELIHDSYIRKNEKNTLVYGVEIDNYNMALNDLEKLIELTNSKS